MKNKFRKQALQRRNEISPALRHEFSQKISTTITALEQFQQATTIHCYVSFGTETETNLIIQTAWEMGKSVVVPITPLLQEDNPFELRHAYIFPNTLFSLGVYNIPVPHERVYDRIELSEADMIIVPLVGFDENCHRIGYGKGYYDRFLSKFTHTFRAGIAFSCQEVPHIETSNYDISLTTIVTEDKIFRK